MLGRTTYAEGCGAHVRSETLPRWSARSELITRRDHPESNGRILTDPSVHFIVLVFDGVLVFIIYLHWQINSIIINDQPDKKFELGKQNISGKSRFAGNKKIVPLLCCQDWLDGRPLDTRVYYPSDDPTLTA